MEFIHIYYLERVVVNMSSDSRSTDAVPRSTKYNFISLATPLAPPENLS